MSAIRSVVDAHFADPVVASLEREAYHVARELKDLQEKQARLQGRAARP